MRARARARALCSDSSHTAQYVWVFGVENLSNPDWSAMWCVQSEEPFEELKETQYISDCAAVLVVCSKDYGSSVTTQRELRMASERQKKLIPLLVSTGPKVDYPPAAVESFLEGTTYIDFRGGTMDEEKFEEKLLSLVHRLKKERIMPMPRGARQKATELYVLPFVQSLSKELETIKMAVMDDTTMTGDRSLQLYRMLEDEGNNNRDKELRKILKEGFKQARLIMKWLAYFSCVVIFILGPVAGIVGGVVEQQYMFADAAFVYDVDGSQGGAAARHLDSMRVFFFLRLWLHMVFVSQFVVSLLFLTIQLFTVESLLNCLLAKRLCRMLWRPVIHFDRDEDGSGRKLFNMEYDMLVQTLETLSSDWSSLLTLSIVICHAYAVGWMIHFFSIAKFDAGHKGVVRPNALAVTPRACLCRWLHN